jgi:hypothetical protein
MILRMKRLAQIFVPKFLVYFAQLGSHVVMILRLALRRTLGNTRVLQPSPLKESRPKIRVRVLLGEEKVMACLHGVGWFIKVL